MRRWLTNLILGRDARQQAYVLRTMMASVSYLIGCVIAETALFSGIAGPQEARTFEFFSVLTAVLSYWLVRSGMTRWLEDPGLTIVQMLVGETMAAIAYCQFHEFRGAMLALDVAVISFGIFNLNRCRQWMMSLYALVTMGGVMLWQSLEAPDRFPPTVEAVHFLILCTLQVVVALLGAEFSELRARLRSRKNALEEALTRIQDLANRDSLTGLYNRRYTQELMDHHISLQGRSGRAFSLALIDLDHFKAVNDQYGHAAGDEVLKQFVTVLRDHFRRTDLVARFGGEEFVVLLPATLLSSAATCVERIRRHLEVHLLVDRVGPITASFGVAMLADGEDSEHLLRRADQALYRSKKEGRNRTTQSIAPGQDGAPDVSSC